ncbi:hypothetical protein ISF6_3569 [Piscinibacter sakaiensis]|uniref:Uncharacterized protein n=1 Tax=Piscinibacter sakaiensis TaxID=1547922 RepID=A0A0K8P511_PISS1|nr:hypothetical protein ISF6_3569 [Piscinibacter sakaiensis]
MPRRPDPADMGIDVGLDETLESRLPPLMDWVAARPPAQGAVVAPLGTDRRSRIA